jgi:hypothetical protein
MISWSQDSNFTAAPRLLQEEMNPWPHDRKAAALPLRQDSPSLLIYVYLINKLIKIINMC